MTKKKTDPVVHKIACIHHVTLSGTLAERIHPAKTHKEVTFHFKPGVNVLCGPNGSGKSTIMATLYPSNMSPGEREFKIKVDPGPCRHMDFEKNNPRVQSSFNDYQPMGFQVVVRRTSHGEMVKALTSGFPKASGLKGACMLMDEPEVALDIDGIFDMVRGLEHRMTHPDVHPINQYVIATHAPAILLNPLFNVIELVPGYRDRVSRSLEAILHKERSDGPGGEP